jgi:DNA replication protein DnaC
VAIIQPFSKWDSIFGDNMMTVAVIDRLVHHSEIFQLQNKRQKQKTTKDYCKVSVWAMAPSDA